MQRLFDIAFAGFFIASAVAGPVEPRQAGQKPKVPVTAELYYNIAKYPAYSTAIYLLPFIHPCIPPFGAVMTDYINEMSTSTQMGIFRNDFDQEIIIGIPGLNSTADIFTTANFELVPYIAPHVDCFGCVVHAGWLADWNSVASQVEDAVQAQLASHPSYSVIVAGHSMGGALCSLTYASLTNAKLPNGDKLPLKTAYCSGSPRVGDFSYANYIDSLSGANDTYIGNYYRITHYNDGVPQLPPRVFGYEHPRTEIWESAYNSTLEATYRCFGQEPDDCNDSVGVGQGINNAHGTYAGLRYNCDGGYLPGPPNP